MKQSNLKYGFKIMSKNGHNTANRDDNFKLTGLMNEYVFYDWVKF